MYAVEFEAVSEGGYIKLPSKYSRIKGNLKILMMFDKSSKVKSSKLNNLDLSAVKIKTAGFKFNREANNQS